MAQDFCAEIAKKKSLLGDISSLASSANPYNMIGNCLGKLVSKSEATTIIKTRITNVVDAETRNYAEQSCSSSAGIIQSNLADNTECVKLLGCDTASLQSNVQLFKSLGMKDADILKMISQRNLLCSQAISAKAVQNNNLTDQQNCTLNSVLDLLAKADLDTNLMAVFQAVMDSKGIGSSSTNNSNTCSDISNSVSLKTYTESVQKCATALNLDQGNISKCMNSAMQSNTADMMRQCVAQSTSSVATNVASNASTSLDSSIDQSSEGVTSSAITSIALLGLGVVVLIIFLRSRM